MADRSCLLTTIVSKQGRAISRFKITLVVSLPSSFSFKVTELSHLLRRTTSHPPPLWLLGSEYDASNHPEIRCSKRSSSLSRPTQKVLGRLILSKESLKHNARASSNPSSAAKRDKRQCRSGFGRVIGSLFPFFRSIARLQPRLAPNSRIFFSTVAPFALYRLGKTRVRSLIILSHHWAAAS